MGIDIAFGSVGLNNVVYTSGNTQRSNTSPSPPNFLNKFSSELSNMIFLTLTEIIDELPLDGDGEVFDLWVLPEV